MTILDVLNQYENLTDDIRHLYNELNNRGGIKYEYYGYAVNKIFIKESNTIECEFESYEEKGSFRYLTFPVDVFESEENREAYIIHCIAEYEEKTRKENERRVAEVMERDREFFERIKKKYNWQ